MTTPFVGLAAWQTPILTIHGSDFFRLEVRRQDDLKHFDVFTMSDLAMTNLRRLMHARARFKPNTALAFLFKLDPILEHIYELKCRFVNVWLT